jgi:hypothetical protein
MDPEVQSECWFPGFGSRVAGVYIIFKTIRCTFEGITDIFYPMDLKDNPYLIWNFGLFF